MAFSVLLTKSIEEADKNTIDGYLYLQNVLLNTVVPLILLFQNSCVDYFVSFRFFILIPTRLITTLIPSSICSPISNV